VEGQIIISPEQVNSMEVNELQKEIASGRFRGYYPVAVDVETGGFNSVTDALLEVAATTFSIDESGIWSMDECLSRHVEPFEGANMDPAALEFTGINPDHPFRKQIAVPEKEALKDIFKMVRKRMKAYGCKRAILVGHNPSFDLGFVNAAVERSGIKRSPFHPFSTFDTATLGGLAYGQTVLSRAVIAAGISWDHEQAHSARYDTEKTAELFCNIVNQWKIPNG
jgi:ribonuclease T